MPSIRVNSVFCYLSLATGSIFIGWLSLVVNMFAATCLLPSIMQPSSIILNNLLIALLFSTFLVHIASCIVAIIGAAKKNPHFMLPWMFGQIFEIIILAITALYVSLVDLPGSLICIIAISVYLPFQLYFWICIYSLYCKMLGDRRKEAFKRLQQTRQIQMKQNIAEATV